MVIKEYQRAKTIGMTQQFGQNGCDYEHVYECSNQK